MGRWFTCFFLEEGDSVVVACAESKEAVSQGYIEQVAAIFWTVEVEDL